MNLHIHSLLALACLLAVTPAFPAFAQSAGDNAGSAEAPPTILRPGDVLKLSIWPTTELNGEFTVEESGNVYLPRLGEVRAAGVSIDDLRNQLREQYRATTTREAVVTVTPVFEVGVLGEVQRPGLYSVTPTSTLFDVIGMAGGFSSFADERRVRIVRDGGVIEVNALRMLETGQGLSSFAPRSGDQIVVGRRSGFRLETARNIMFLIQSVVLAATLVERLQDN